jgi:hypothetical protein
MYTNIIKLLFIHNDLHVSPNHVYHSNIQTVTIFGNPSFPNMLDITALTVATDIQVSKNYTYDILLHNIKHKQSSKTWPTLITVFHYFIKPGSSKK